MLVRQSINTFIREMNGYGYVMNQMTFQDRTYNSSGTIFLFTLTREPQSVDDIVRNKLMPRFEGVDYQTLYDDFVEFITELSEHHFVVIGETPEELDRNETEFSYANGNMKTSVNDFTQHTKQKVEESTQNVNLEGAQRKPSLSTMQIEVTSQCNERCIHCYIPNAKKNAGKNMPIEKIKSLIDEFAEMGGLHVTLSGGEAFMHDKLIEILRYCREKDMRVSILSNLIALRDDHVRAIKDANVSVVQTSLYSMVPEHHDMITSVKGSFARTKAAIEKLVAADIPVQISCPVMKANARDYKDVMLYAQSLNIKAQTDYIMMAQCDLDPSNLANRLSLEETERVIRDIIEYDIDYMKENLGKQRPKDFDIEFNRERFLKQPLCGAALNECCIGENGDVFPCSGWQGFVLGNVYEQSLKDIWENSEKAREIRGVTQADFPKCMECEAFNFCSRCLVRNFNECDGDMFALPQHFCDVAFLNKRLVEEYEAKLKRELSE